jgi:hypothetical protein
VRLIHAPGELRGAVLEARRWRHHEGELVIECRTTNGAGHTAWQKSIHANKGHRLLGVLIVTQDHRHHTTCGLIKRVGR